LEQIYRDFLGPTRESARNRRVSRITTVKILK